tara:strand:+ start:3532 stop:3717 length:186 start_codon:yes stop_codon:yes gene_type:complete
MKVNLKRNFWDGERQWLHFDSPVEMPDEMADRLPSDAEIVGGSKATKSKPSRSPKSDSSAE